MPITSINRVKTITLELNSQTSNQVLTIYQNNNLVVGSELIFNHPIISSNCFIKNLKAFSKIASLPEIQLPDFELEDSETDKLYKTLDIEWKSARKQISLHISSSSQQAWSQIGSVSILNPAGYPFRIYNLMDLFTDNIALELGENSRIGVSIDDVGFGKLEGLDEITIHGSYVEEIFVMSPDLIQPITINITNTGGGTASLPSGSDYSFSNSSIVDNSFILDNSFGG